MHKAIISIGLVALAGCSAAPQDNAETASGDQSEGLRLGMVQALKDARAAGIPCNSDLVMAGAIAAAESSLNTSAQGSNGPTSGCPSGSVDRGLWQINSCYHSEYSSSCVFDGACNAKAMYAISNHGTNWGPWSTFHNGAYKSHLGEAQAAYNVVCGGGGGGGGGGADPGCYSNTFQTHMPDNACVESKFDLRWYQCKDGWWADRWSDPEACNGVHSL